MSFRGRLRLFFTIIVVVPMIAVAVGLYLLTARSEDGKADAAIAAGLRTAFAVYDEAAARAEPTLRQVAQHDGLRRALTRGSRSAAERRVRQLARPPTVAIELYDGSGEPHARAGAAGAVAYASAPLRASGRRLGTLALSVTTASDLASEVHRLSGLELSVFRAGRRLASTRPALPGAAERLKSDDSRDFELDGREYRGRLERLPVAAGPPIELAVFEPTEELSGSTGESWLPLAVILAVAIGLALLSSVFVVRALQIQVAEFLGAARRVARGDFGHPVPAEGQDEFAQLGREFNRMSEQLAAKIEEVQHKRDELEETIRRVGAALASGLDRQGVVELAVQTAVDACEAEAGRALPVDVRAFDERRAGRLDAPLEAALRAAERRAFEVQPWVGAELLQPGATGERHAVVAVAEGAHGIAVRLQARLGTSGTTEYVGVMSIARRGEPFSRQEQELLEYLAGQAVVSIENADLHQTVQREAITDDLTGLANLRELHITLDREVERSRRFESPLGFVMVDLDDFKKVNDQHGHQQGDEVLVQVARVLRELSRDIDEPARYGGEELCVVLPETDSDGAAQLAERMREAIERLRITRVRGDGYLRITASFGVGSIPATAVDKSSLIAAADAALYRAKRAGKNRVERADPLAVPR